MEGDVEEKTIVNIDSVKKDNGNIVVGVIGQEKYVHLPFNKKDKYFMNPADFIKFIKATEGSIRHSREYSRYIAYLKNDVGLQNCALFPNIGSEVPIEFHHMIFTLFDIVEIQIAYLFKAGDRINSSNVTHHVLEDHFKNMILMVPLCEMAHKAYHASLLTNTNIKNYFIDIRSGWGSLFDFVNKYHDAMSVNHYIKLKKYFEQYKKYAINPDKPSVFGESITKWADIFNGEKAKEATET